MLPIQLELGSGEGELEQSWDISAIMSHARAVTKLKDADKRVSREAHA